MNNRKEEILKEYGGAWNSDLFIKEEIILAMDEYATECVKSNAKALVNLIVQECKAHDSVGQDPTIKDLRDIIQRYAKEMTIGFFKWYGVKMASLIEYITKIKPLVESNEMEEKIKEFEGKSFDQLYSLYLDSIK